MSFSEGAQCASRRGARRAGAYGAQIEWYTVRGGSPADRARPRIAALILSAESLETSREPACDGAAFG